MEKSLLTFVRKPANAFGAATPATAATGSSYGEVPDQMRSQLDELEQFIESQKQAVEEVKSTTTYQEILQIHVITEQINLKSHGLKNLLDRDETVIKELRSLMNEETKIADGASRFIDRYNNPHYTFQQHANDPTSKDYFSNVTDQLERRLQIYRQTIDDLERHFQTITQKPHYTPQAIADILRSQHESFMSIAGKIALVHDGITKEKERFLMYRNKYFGDNRNPFKDGAASAAKETPLSAIAAELQPSANAQQPAQQGQMGQTGQTGQMGTMGGFGGVGGFGASTAPSTGFGTSGFSFGKK
ncbi:hypothetical protein BC829DRAFT_393609 [Chytridium lagenaria]|nr:hypothetical protein BC829DRAFT_393609 [Chytridium lagenaria]